MHAAPLTPCDAAGTPDVDASVRKGRESIDAGMSGVMYCGSMSEWPLFSDEQRMEGVRRLVDAGVPLVVGTGAQSPAAAAAHATHARDVGAQGLMVIPWVLSRGTSSGAQREHLAGVLGAAPDLPAVIDDSPYHGYETGPALYFELRREHANLVGFEEFGGAAAGDAAATRLARELDDALHVLSTFDEGPDLVLCYEYLATLLGDEAYTHPVEPSDTLSASQRRFVEAQLLRFRRWWRDWPGAGSAARAGAERP